MLQVEGKRGQQVGGERLLVWEASERAGPGNTGMGGGTMEHPRDQPRALGVSKFDHGELISPCSQV